MKFGHNFCIKNLHCFILYVSDFEINDLIINFFLVSLVRALEKTFFLVLILLTNYIDIVFLVDQFFQKYPYKSI